jgi:hypothetical protein
VWVVKLWGMNLEVRFSKEGAQGRAHGKRLVAFWAVDLDFQGGKT